MPKEIDDKVWEEVKKAYLAGKETYASLALRFGIGKSTIEAKAASDKWKDLKKVNALTQPTASIDNSPSATPAPLPPPLQKETLRDRRQQRQGLDEVEMVEDAIYVLSAGLQSAEIKSAEAAAATMAKLIELHNKLVPKTAADLADMAIALGISPAEFIRALNDQCQKKA